MSPEELGKIEILPSDKITMVPYWFDGRKISIAQMVNTPEFKSLEPRFALNVLDMIRDNPSIGILRGGADRSENEVRNLFYQNYRKMGEQKDYENIPSYYPKIKNGKIKWNPEDKQWYKLATKKVVAVPGGSWHTGGYAVDFTGDTDLAGKVSDRYSITQITGTGEKHHFQPAGLPTSKRMFKYLEERYNLDPIANPLPKELIAWIDSEVASNVPRQPERILGELDKRVFAYKNSISPKVRVNLPQGLDERESQFFTPTPTTIPSTTTMAPTTTLAPTTTFSPTTTVASTTTTPAPTTTVAEQEQIGGQRSASPSQYEFAGKQTPTTTSIPPRTTTSTPSTTTIPPTTTTQSPVTTVPPTTTSTTMPAKKQSTTTTQPPVSPDSTIPGETPIGGLGISSPTSSGLAGGVTKNYKPPTNAQLKDTANPYTYTNEDWQLLITMPQTDVVAIQQNLMKAFPGFKPTSLGNRYDPKTIKYFKSALGRINQFSADPEDPFGVRGKTTVEAIKAIAKNPMALTGATGTSLPTYRLTSPTDLKAVFKKASEEMLGRSLGEGDLNRLIQAYQTSETQYQKAASTAGATAVQAPSPTTFAMDKIQKDFGDEVDTNKMDNIFSAVDKALSGGQR